MTYPFAALVGQEHLKIGLLLNAVYPGVGGVLIRGERGTAKSTAARGLAELLPPLRAVAGCPYRCDPEATWAECPHCTALTQRDAVEVPAPFVNLPIGATEDRVLGTLDFERALREGRRAFQPGLLAAAHRGILYIDEVNLLPDHLVDVLLDAAALGVNNVQREGVSLAHPARFILVGTMNPEEGDLRPQFLDRFGLTVTVVGPSEPAERAEVVRRRVAFEADPAVFAAQWREAQAALRGQIRAAHERFAGVGLSDGLLTFISRLCCEFGVEGMRGDVVLHKAARAHAAWEDRLAVTTDDVRIAGELALPHRRRRNRPAAPGEHRPGGNDRPSSPVTPPSTGKPQAGGPASAPPNAAPARPSSAPSEPQASDPPPSSGDSLASPSMTLRNPQLSIDVAGGQGPSRAGRRNPAASSRGGHYVRAVPDESPASLALDATLRAAVNRGARVEDGVVAVARADLHRKERRGTTGTLILFVVDASGSMAARQRMEAVKGAVLGLLQDAYEQRDEVGVIAFRGLEAQVLLPPTRSVDLAEQALRTLPTGGRTPLAHALVLANETVARERRARPDVRVLLMLLSDGKANVSLPDSAGNAWHQALEAASTLAMARVPALVLDTDVGFVRVGRAREIAGALEAEYLPLEDLSAEALVLKIRKT